jgi:cytochrome c553
MRKFICLLSCLCAWFAYAAGDYQAGQTKSMSCAACHGEKGISSNALWPNLAGQHVSYIIKQLHDFKNDKRHSDLMSPFVASLTEQDMDDLAMFYSRQPVAKVTNIKLNQHGEALYRNGDMSKHITACIACHGPYGTGNGQAGFPVLSGQQKEYTVSQLKAFKEKTRHNDLNEIMQMISARMSADDMADVAAYLVSLKQADS